MTQIDSTPGKIEGIILISANAEWVAAKEVFTPAVVMASPLGDYFPTNISGFECLFFHGGWGKVAAAASTQYVIDHWHPDLIVNAGTCGGLEGHIAVGDILLVSETMIYDIFERMSDPQPALDHYASSLDLSFISRPYPQDVKVGRLVSADQDIDPAMVDRLIEKFQATAADWESGAIAWTAARNQARLIILRVVSDLVNSVGGELYAQGDFAGRAGDVMRPLLLALPAWIRCALSGNTKK